MKGGTIYGSNAPAGQGNEAATGAALGVWTAITDTSLNIIYSPGMAVWADSAPIIDASTADAGMDETLHAP
jgi:hypothetical protein